MDFNDLIEKEIESRAQARVKEILAKRNKEFYENLKHKLTAKVYEVIDELAWQNQKCDYTTCPNYNDGTIDETCKSCGSLLTKDVKSTSARKNLEDSKATNAPKGEPKFVNSVPNTTPINEYPTNPPSKNEEELIKDLKQAFEPVLNLCGISQDEIDKMKFSSVDPKVKEALDKLFETFSK